MKPVCQVLLEYQFQPVIDFQDCVKRHPEIALAIKGDSELADCIWNGVEEIYHDFLLVQSAKERKEYFDHTFGGMCIKHIHYFQLSLNHHFIFQF